MKIQIISGGTFKGYPLLAYDGPDTGYREDILQRIKERLEESLQQTSKVLVVRLVIRLPQVVRSDGSNDCFQYFIEEYRRVLVHNLLHYVWVREQHLSHNPHWHVVLFLNGNEIRYFKYTYQAEYFWSLALRRFYGYSDCVNGLVHICHGGYQGVRMNHGIMVPRDNLAMRAEVFKACSYLAKIYTKGNAPKNVREHGSSILKKIKDK